MILARVTGTLVSTQKNRKLDGAKLLLVQPLTLEDTARGPELLAVDGVGAGVHEKVLIVLEGRAASDAIGAYYAVALGETLAASVEASFGRTDTPPMPFNVRANLDRFKAEVTAERTRVGREYMKTLVELEALVDKLQLPNRNRPAVMSTQAGK